jgi:hypothetical protein
MGTDSSVRRITAAAGGALRGAVCAANAGHSATLEGA